MYRENALGELLRDVSDQIGILHFGYPSPGNRFHAIEYTCQCPVHCTGGIRVASPIHYGQCTICPGVILEECPQSNLQGIYNPATALDVRWFLQLPNGNRRIWCESLAQRRMLEMIAPDSFTQFFFGFT